MITPERHRAENGKVTWRIRFRHGNTQTSETFQTRKDAERFSMMIASLGPQGALEQMYAETKQSKVPSLDAVAADHIAMRANTTDGTRLNYERLWARTWGPLVGFLPANQLTDDDLSRAAMTLGKTYSRKSLENQRGLLSGVVGRAVRLGYLTDNLARGMRLPAGVHGDSAEMRILAPEEFAVIADYIAEHHPHYLTFVRFLYATGARWGEAVALQVQDVQLPNVRIHQALKWSPDNNRPIGTTKTKKGRRTIAITGEMREEIADLCAGRPGKDLLFTAVRGGEIRHRSFWGRVWVPAASQLTPRPRIHDLRHSHASWLLSQGIPIHVLQRRLGHQSIQTTVDVYGHLMPDAQMLAADAADMAFVRRQLNA